MGFFGWLGDAVGWDEGEWYEGWGVGDQSGAYQGFLGTGGEGTGTSPTPADPVTRDRSLAEAKDLIADFDYEGAFESAEQAAKDKYGTTGKTAGEWGQQAAEKEEDLLSFSEWLEENDYDINTSGEISDVRGNISDIADALAAGPSDEMQEEAWDHAARLLGLTDEEAQSIIGDLTTTLAGYDENMTTGELERSGVLDQFEGMSPEEEALRRRQNQSNVRAMEARARRMVQNSLAETGSTARMLQTADEATQQINNAQLRQDAELAQEQFERQLAELQSTKQQWAQMVDTRQMGYQQYIQMEQQAMSRAMEGYARELDSMLAENQQYMQQWTGDMDVIQAQAANLYQAANLQLGLDNTILAATEQLYRQNLQPLMDQVSGLLTAADISDPAIIENIATLVQIASQGVGMAVDIGSLG